MVGVLQAIYSGALARYEQEVEGGLRLRAGEHNILGRPRHQEGHQVDVSVDPAAFFNTLQG